MLNRNSFETQNSKLHLPSFGVQCEGKKEGRNMPRLCCKRIRFCVAFQCHLGFRFIKSSGIFNPYVINSDVTTKFEPDFVGVVARPTNHWTGSVLVQGSCGDGAKKKVKRGGGGGGEGLKINLGIPSAPPNYFYQPPHLRPPLHRLQFHFQYVVSFTLIKSKKLFDHYSLWRHCYL